MKSIKTYTIALLMLPVLFFSCSDFLDLPPDNVVAEADHFQNVYDADAAVRGIYGKLVQLADEYVILNELRADLMDVTNQAGNDLREINLHTATSENPYANPDKFFSLINDCNDALEKFTAMLDNLKISKEAYVQRYADVATVRSWLYLQLVIQFGEVPYITESIDNVSELALLENNTFPVLGIEVMVDSLVSFMESLPYQGLYTDASMNTTIDGYNTKTMFIDKEYLLGELYLWQGNYLAAATQFKNILERPTSINEYDSYKIATDFFTDDKYNSRYIRYYESDYNSPVNNWPKMFSDLQTTSFYGEWLWVLYFSENYEPRNPFIDLLSYKYGSYQLKPSEVAISNWDSVQQKNGFMGDFRGLNSSYTNMDNVPVINKFIADYDGINEPTNRSGRWSIWRAASLHLRFSEAANRDGQPKLACALMNQGIKVTYDDPSQSDYYTKQQSNLPFPYDFDGRQSGSSDIPPNVRGEYYRNIGVRGRVYAASLNYPAGIDSVLYTEDKILDESALELAFEGNRWGDLVRIAIRRGDNAILADRVYNKLVAGGYPEAAAVREKLMNRENWFIPIVNN